MDAQLPDPSFRDSTSSEDLLKGDVIASSRGEHVTQAWLWGGLGISPLSFDPRTLLEPSGVGYPVSTGVA